ncbi:MAG: CBS domain-containing protein [Chloroflexi bacterium]|nr:MAG: CBS domain-containing protein [Chloroflexota bacterium]
MTREQSPRELLVIILNDRERLPDLLKNLYAAGVPGATVLDSVGGYATTSWLEELGLGSVARLFHINELKQNTVLAVMEKSLIDTAIAAAEKAVGGFGRPDSGLLFTVPVGHTVGLYKRKRPEEPKPHPTVSETDKLVREMTVKQAAEEMQGSEVIVHSDATLAEIARAMLEKPATQVAAVVSREDHLIGIIPLQALADRVFFRVIPELFYREVSDQEEAIAFGQLATDRIAADFMMLPVSVHADDPIREAFRLMHEHKLGGLPVIDDENHVIGFVSLLELIELVLREEGEINE